MVNWDRGRQYFVHEGYNIRYGKQVRNCFDTKSPLKNYIPKWGETKPLWRIFALQTGSLVQDTCSDFIRRDFQYGDMIYGTTEHGLTLH